MPMLLQANGDLAAQNLLNLFGLNSLGQLALNAAFIVMVLVVAYLLQAVLAWFIDWNFSAKSFIGRRRKITEFGLKIAKRFTTFFIYFVALAFILGAYNIDLTAIIAVLGVGGIAVALAAQETLSNLIAGFVLLTDKPFKVGDRISLRSSAQQRKEDDADEWGYVIDIGWRSTRIRTKENIYLTIPNAELTKREIYNYTIKDPTYRLWMPLQISYESDYDKAKALLLQACRESPFVIQGKRNEAVHKGFGDSGVKLMLRVWIKNAEERGQARSDLYERIQRAFKENGIVIPYPRIQLVQQK